jgi:5'-nucleotidase
MDDCLYPNRRDFIKFALGTGLAFSGLSASAQNLLVRRKGIEQLTILYTNDQHSRIEPFPETDAKHPGQGGFSKRAALIEKLRKENQHVLLLDAGDIFQGTPYFNFFKGEAEYKLMNLMGYDAVTFGNHDFDLGIENLTTQMPKANFDFINCNYDFRDTDLKKHPNISRFKIYRKGPLKIGVLGVGIELNGLIETKNRQGLVYNNPIESANKIATILKKDEKCHFVICLSHLGFKYETDKVSDVVLASQSRNIDLIIGGHTHTFLKEPEKVMNAENKPVMVTQVGWAGIWLGQTDVFFTDDTKKILQNNSPHQI